MIAVRIGGDVQKQGHRGSLPSARFPLLLASIASATEPGPSDQFVVRKGDKLLLGDREFRFLSWNIPNLHYVEDDMRFTEPMPFRWRSGRTAIGARPTPSTSPSSL